MTTSGFDPEISNANLNAAQYYIDDDGALKFVSPYISSSNFDGTIPVVETSINAENIEPGMLLQVDAGEYLPVISVSYDDIDLESSPSSTITVGYVDSNNELNTIDYNFTDSVDVRYEDWANKDLGSQGWSITSGGNAIFANVGIRGDLEATTLDVGGTSGITYDGSTVTIGASVIVNAPITFNGVTEATLSASLAGYIPDGGAASDVNSNFTTISGGKIRTGILESTGYSGVTDGTAFSTTGMAVNLDNGSITAKSFRIDTAGNALFSGSVVAKGGYFGNSSYGMSIVDDGSTVTIRTTTLRMGSQNVSGTLHGSIDFYTTGGGSIGQISSAASNKTWSGLGDGIILGTTSDYLFIPSSGNTTRSRYYGSGFEWYNTSGQTIMSIAGGTGGLRINTGGGLTGNGITSSNANIEVTGTGKFVGDGSLLTNLPGGGGGSIPTGTIVMYGGNSAPAGWLFCDGSAVSRSTYSGLWNILGTSYGSGNGSTTFNLPDFTSTFPRGGTNTDTSRGNTGGQASFTIAEANLPNHNHGVGTLAIGGTSGGSGALSHSGTVDSKGGHTHTSLTATTAAEPSHQHGVGTYVIGGSTGNGGAHSHTYTAPNSPNANRGTGTSNAVTGVTAGTATSNEPSHSHGAGTLAITGQSGSQGGHSHSVTFNWTGADAGSHQHNITVNDHASHTHGAGSLALSGNTGNWGTATPSSINNQPPYLVVNFIIKT